MVENVLQDLIANLYDNGLIGNSGKHFRSKPIYAISCLDGTKFIPLPRNG